MSKRDLKIKISARISPEVYKIIKTWANIHHLTFTDALEDLVRSGKAKMEPKVIKEMVEKTLYRAKISQNGKYALCPIKYPGQWVRMQVCERCNETKCDLKAP